MSALGFLRRRGGHAGPAAPRRQQVDAETLRRVRDGLREQQGSGEWRSITDAISDDTSWLSAPDPDPHGPSSIASLVAALRPYPRIPAFSPPVPVTAAESADRIARLVYPPYGAPREQWAAVMRQVSAWTGTRSMYDQPEAWTAARPGPAEAPVTAWTPQRPALLAIEAGTEEP